MNSCHLKSKLWKTALDLGVQRNFTKVYEAIMDKMSILVSLFMLLAVAKADDHHRFAYVQRELQLQLSCEQFPKTALCPGLDIKVVVNTSSISLDSLKLVNLTLSGFNESCINAVLKVQCLGLPRCNEEKGESAVDSSAALSECNKGQNMCPSIARSIYLNCSALAEQYKQQTTSLKIGKCETVKDTSGFCPDVKYKRFVAPGMNTSSYFGDNGPTNQGIEKLKSNLTSECYESYKSFMCSSQPACSDDEQYVVWLVSKQDCMEALQCIPKEMQTREDLNSTVVCLNFPDAESSAVKKVPYPGGTYINPSPSPKPTSTISTSNVINPATTSTADSTSSASSLKKLLLSSAVSMVFVAVCLLF